MREHMKFNCCTPPSGCCDGDTPIVRRFRTHAEQLEELKEYKEQLEKELAWVM
jgi:hypothetical protein